MGEQTSSIRLKPLNVPGWGSPIEVPDDGLIIGREKTNDVVVASVDFPHVSSRHARVSVVNGDYVVTDLDSKNGTLVDNKAVQDHRLKPGEIIQLGYRGPKFLVLSEEMTGEELEPTMLETVDALPTSVNLDREHDTILRVKRALGLPDGSNVDDLVRARSRRLLLVCSIATVALVAGTWVVASRVNQPDPSVYLTESLNKQQEEFERFKAQLVQHARQLGDEIRGIRQRLEASGSTGDNAELAKLLEEKQSRLEELLRIQEAAPPVRDAAAEVAQVKPAVVLIYLSIRYRQVGTGEYLFMDGEKPNFAGRGVQYVMDSWGTGVCVSERGEILTNAHLAEPEPLDLTTWGWTVEAEIDYRVQFAYSSEGHAARLLKSDAGVDLALLSIEPFPQMPVVPEFSTRTARPVDGERVWVVGFPFKSFQVMTGVATSWDEFLKLDCTIYPGASGSPVVNERGQVVGIAKGRVERDDGQPLDNMGVAIPIAEAARVWTP